MHSKRSILHRRRTRLACFEKTLVWVTRPDCLGTRIGVERESHPRTHANNDPQPEHERLNTFDVTWSAHQIPI